MTEYGKNEAERWFERYLRDHDYEYEYEPDLGVGKRPDFLIRRNGIEIVCEVKGFDEVPGLEQRLSGTNQPVMASSDEVYGPMRGAVREAARQLKSLAGHGVPLVVVLANPAGYLVHLEIERLIEAMFGNPGWSGRFNPAEGRVEDLEFRYGRDGRLRSDHPYISAVAILRERETSREYYERWREQWKATRQPIDNPSYNDVVQEFMAEQEAWDAHASENDVPEGTVYFVEVMTTGSSDASELPEAVFDGPRDRRVTVRREIEGQ